MIQIIICRCSKLKFRESRTAFYSQNEIYENIKDVFVVPFPMHPLFKE